MYIGNISEYYKAAKRLDQIIQAEPDTEEAQELKSIMLAIVQYVKDKKRTAVWYLISIMPGTIYIGGLEQVF